MTKYAMIIDLNRCVGCGGCDIACKSENNVPDNFHWADHEVETYGKFPDVKYRHIPKLCNHCDNAPCVRVCPTKAMHKKDDGITMHDPKKCIGCKSCVLACPYEAVMYNDKVPFKQWNNKSELIKGGTASPKELKDKSKVPFPNYNPERSLTSMGVREKGVVEKCTFCDHRVGQNKLPFCVESCPASARIFGDIKDVTSQVSKLKGKYELKVRKLEKGTRPNVFYIREYYRV